MLRLIFICIILHAVLAIQRSNNQYGDEYLKQISQDVDRGKLDKSRKFLDDNGLWIEEGGNPEDDSREEYIKNAINEAREEQQRNHYKNTQKRLFDWIKSIFEKQTSETVTVSPKQNKIEKNVSISKYIDIDKVVLRLVTELENINNNLVSLKNIGYYVIQIPAKEKILSKSPTSNLRKRIRRNVVTDQSKTKDLLKTQNKEGVSNNNTQDLKKSRRTGIENEDIIKLKLIKYINETFTEIDNKMELFRVIQQIYSDNSAYKIGYLNSNVDTLALNLINLKKDVNNNKNIWDDKTVLDLYDKLKEMSKVLSNLLDLLKNFMAKSTQYQIGKKGVNTT